MVLSNSVIQAPPTLRLGDAMTIIYGGQLASRDIVTQSEGIPSEPKSISLSSTCSSSPVLKVQSCDYSGDLEREIY